MCTIYLPLKSKYTHIHSFKPTTPRPLKQYPLQGIFPTKNTYNMYHYENNSIHKVDQPALLYSTLPNKPPTPPETINYFTDSICYKVEHVSFRVEHISYKAAGGS